MKANFIKIAMFSLMLLFTGCSIEGIVTNEAGDNVANATIVATYGEEVQEVQSNSVGEYTLDGIDSGVEVNIVVSKKGYITQSQEAVGSNDVTYVDFVLKAEGDVIPLNITSIVGRYIDSNGKPIGGKVRVKDGYGHGFDRLRDEDTEDGRFELTKNTFAESLLTRDDIVVLKFHFSRSGMNTIDFERTYNLRDYVDANDSSKLDIGDIVLEVGTVRGCAKNLLGFNFGALVYSYQEGSISGIALDHHFSTEPKHIYNDDMGEFEFEILKDNREHTLTLRDSLGNTNSMSFIADSNDIDLRDNCVQTKFKVIRNVEVSVVVDSNHSLDANIKVLESSTDEEIPVVNGKFKISKSEYYNIVFTGKDAIDYKPGDDMSFTSDKLEYTFTVNGNAHKLKSIWTLPNDTNHLTYWGIFGLYQGDIVSDYIYQ